MPTLALEFSTRFRSVAATRDESSPIFTSTAEGMRTTGTMELVGKVLEAAHLRITDIDTVLVGIGPGSYTGVRAALAFAEGWKLATEGTILAIPTNHILAHGLTLKGASGKWRIIIDAQKKEFYSATYSLAPGNFVMQDAIKIVSTDELTEATSAHEQIAGPEALRLCGGVDLYPLAESMIQISRTLPQLMQMDLEPIYLRPISFVKAPKRPPLPDGLSR
ncbi:MAG: tsaB [Verrucomicrobiales bacterium]|nr:tsaB [Verrucomicrobiales bacterium]